MSRLEELRPHAGVHGVLSDALVSAINPQWYVSEALELTYKYLAGRITKVSLYRHDEPRLEVVEHTCLSCLEYTHERI